jgi:D-beta-D-heptose 7-phosphate kinase/D-beta-D-heptose 1-phosphate adenosyltransferase
MGGAANVAANVAATGARVTLVGAAGADAAGDRLRTMLEVIGADSQALISTKRPTTSKTRVVARAQQMLRFDEEDDGDLPGRDVQKLLDTMLPLLAKADALVLEDYNKGVLESPLIGSTIAAARQHAVPVVVDPKYRHFFEYRGATVFKPNLRELEAALGASVDLERRPGALADVVSQLGIDHLLLTLGAGGMVLVRRNGETTHVPSVARSVYDVSGAGDTVTAWVATTLASGGTVDEAAYLANVAAGVEVAKAGVAIVSPEEVLAAHEERFDTIGRLRRGGAI